MMVAYLVKIEVVRHPFHEPHEAPESVHFVATHDEKNWGQQVRHALHITKVEVVHHISHQNLEKIKVV